MLPIRRAIQARRVLLTRNIRIVHSSDSYSKEVDSTPPPDSKIHRVDPEASTSQKPYEMPAGEWSEVGAKSAMQSAYATMDKKEPYTAPGPKERYGAVDDLKAREGEANEGPTGKDSHGRK
ncbi:hypothetical protein BDZ89DRAFT_1070488 [Hymenopellis radicata]|nr:hypothetical protein BDZ89DRAFT_1070488 [Hymenopellis radicata]